MLNNKIKEKIVLALDVETIEEAKELVEELKDYTGTFKVGLQLFMGYGLEIVNYILSKNAELLKQNSVDVAKESERGIVDLETLKKVNADLISTIEETIKIQQEGRAARQNAEVELAGIEERLKQTMLSAVQN